MTKLGEVQPRLEIQGDAAIAAKYVERGKSLFHRVEAGRQYEYYGDCIIEVFRAEEWGYIRLIVLTSPELVFQPRSGDLVDTPFWYSPNDAYLDPPEPCYQPAIVGVGWYPGDDETQAQEHVPPQTPDGYIEVDYTRPDIFPITSRKTALAKSPDVGTKLGSFTWMGDKSDYGNLFWSAQEGSSVVSWKGSPVRLFRDTKKQYYETFASSVYQKGKAIAGPAYSSQMEDGGDYVLGAAAPNGEIYVVGYHRMSPVQIRISKYVDGEWLPLPIKKVGDKWESENAPHDTGAGYTGLPWFADKTGYMWIRPDGAKINVNVTADAESFTYIPAPVNPEGTGNESRGEGGAPNWTEDYSGGKSLYEYSHLADGAEVFATISKKVRVTTTNYGDGDSTNAALQAESLAVTGFGLSVSGPYDFGIGAVYQIHTDNSYCDVNWNVPGGYSGGGSSIVITSVNGCGMSSVSATLVGGGNDGQSASMEVKMPSGTWVYSHCTGSPCTTAWPPYSPCYCRCVRGGGQYVEYYATITTFLYCNPPPPCPEGWMDMSAALAGCESGSGCYGDGGFTGGCCACSKYSFTYHYVWVCP